MTAGKKVHPLIESEQCFVNQEPLCIGVDVGYFPVRSCGTCGRSARCTR